MDVKNMLLWALRRGQVKAMLRRIADKTSQLEKFNAVWADAVANVPFYAEWKKLHGLPDRIEDLGELQHWPVVEKRDLVLNRGKLIRRDVTKSYKHETGGATGEPLHFRVMPEELEQEAVSKWIAWARLGIYPDSRCFLLWGHRHFYGLGVAGKVRFAVRRLKDWMTNNFRADATDLSPAALRRDYRLMLKFSPECIVAYSASLLALVRTVRGGEEVRNGASGLKVCPSLRAVICSAGPLTKEERGEIEAFFGVPVTMEYGSMEAGAMAYQTKDNGGRYGVFHATHLFHVMPEAVSGSRQLLVTKLFKGYLPLIRYKVGDCILGETVDDKGLVVDFAEVYGRTGDDVDMGNGVRFHGQIFMRCAAEIDRIVAYQIRVNKAAGKVAFVAQTLSPLSTAEKAEIVRHATQTSGLSPEAITVVESDELVKAPSGKIRLVIEEAR